MRMFSAPKRTPFDGVESDLRPLEPDIGVHGLGEAVEPLAFPLVLVVEELDALHRPQGLDEVRGLVRLGLNHPLAQIAQVAEERDADHA